MIHYKTFGYMPGTLEENSKVLGGFCWVCPYGRVCGQGVFSSELMWYLLALMMGWILLDILFNAFPERYLPFAVAATAVLGWGTCLVWELPFSISQGMVIVPYLYIGHLIKNTAAGAPDPKWLVGVILASTLAVALGAWAAGSTDSSLWKWTLGPLSIFWMVLWAAGWCWCFALEPGPWSHRYRTGSGGAALFADLLRPHSGADRHPLVSVCPAV